MGLLAGKILLGIAGGAQALHDQVRLAGTLFDGTFISVHNCHGPDRSLSAGPRENDKMLIGGGLVTYIGLFLPAIAGGSEVKSLKAWLSPPR